MYQYEKQKKFYMRLLPIILMIGFIPLIVHMYQYNCNLSQFEWFPDGNDTQYDFFLAWKMFAVIGVAVLMIVIMACRHLFAEDKFLFEKPFAFLGVYLLMVLLSAVLSQHQYFVAHGTYELFEPVWVVIAYLILCYYTYNYVREERQVNMVLGWSGIGMVLLSLLGVFQYVGYDLFRTDFGKKLITNRDFWNHLDSITMNFAEKNSYATLYNPNYLSFYFGMLIPLLLCLLIGAKKVWQKVLIAIAEVLCLVCLKGSGCVSGWLALAISGVLLVLILLSRERKPFMFGTFVVFIGVVLAFIVLNTTSFGQSVKNTVTGTFYLQDKFELRSIETDTDHVTLDIKGTDLLMTFDSESDGTILTDFTDADGNKLSLKLVDQEKWIYQIEDKRFTNVKVQPLLLDEENNIPCVMVMVDDAQWMFMNAGNADYYFINKAGKPVKCEAFYTSRIFKDDAMSGRGHIWNNTIPLLKKHILFGSGANAYMFEYPQEDYVGQQYIYQNGYQVKAHCWYLQQFVENGVIGTLALMLFLGWYIIRSIRIYRLVDLHNRLSWVGFGLFSAVFVYLVTALANDSNVCTAPGFWGMLGLGLAVNRMLVEKKSYL